jgi:hypothetical protein
MTVAERKNKEDDMSRQAAPIARITLDREYLCGKPGKTPILLKTPNRAEL